MGILNPTTRLKPVCVSKKKKDLGSSGFEMIDFERLD